MHAGGRRLFTRDSASNFPYRKSRGGEVWHYSEYCSGWPADDFIELDFPPEAELCNECRARLP